MTAPVRVSGTATERFCRCSSSRCSDSTDRLNVRVSVGVQWELPGRCGAYRPASRPRFLSQSLRVEGHSLGAGAPNALFTANSARQYCCLLYTSDAADD